MDISELPYQTEEEQEAQDRQRRKKQLVWIILGSTVGMVFLAALVGTGIFVWQRFLSGADPLAKHVPADVNMYGSVNLVEYTSDEVAQVIDALENVAPADDEEDTTGYLDELTEAYNLNIDEDIIPWIGQYVGVVVTRMNLQEDLYEYAVIVESRNGEKADAFLAKLADSIASEEDRTFETQVFEEITFYTSEAEGSWDEPIVMVRDGNLVFIGNSQEAITQCLGVSSENSLAKSDAYKAVMAGLPKDRLGSFYINSNFLTESLEELDISMMPDMTSIEQFTESGLEGMGFSLSVPGDGIRLDFNATYSEEALSEYMQQYLSMDYRAPSTAGMVAEDVFLFIGQEVPNYTQLDLEDSPYYTEDFQESMELLEKELGFDLLEMIQLMSGELGIALGPAHEGILAESDMNMGFVAIIGVNDEAKADEYAHDLFRFASEQIFWGAELTEVELDIPGYDMVELVMDSGYYKETFLTYGIGNGYVIAGSGSDMIETGLTGPSLADSAAYQETWTHFPKNSVPVIYLDLQGLFAFIKESDPYSFDEDYDLDIFKTFGAAASHPDGNSYGGTLYLLLDL